MASTRKYDFKLTANGSYLLPASGVMFRLISTSAAISVQLSTGETVEGIITGQGIKNAAFNALTLLNNTGAVVTGTILVSDAEFIDIAMSGDVSINNFGCAQVATEMTSSTPGEVINALPLNSKRRYLFIQNKSNANMYVTVDAFGDPAAYAGIVLEPFEKYEPVSPTRFPVRLCCPDGSPLWAVVIEG